MYKRGTDKHPTKAKGRGRDLFADVLGEAKDDRGKNIVSDSERRLTHWLMRLRRLKPGHFATKKKEGDT